MDEPTCGSSIEELPTGHPASKTNSSGNQTTDPERQQEKDVEGSANGPNSYTADSASPAAPTETDNDAIKRHLVGDHLIPVANMTEPMWTRLCRHPDPDHVDALAARFKSCPDAPYTILAVHIAGVTPEEFNSKNLQSYSYEVLGGNHTRLALQKLLREDSGAAVYKNHMARVYCDLPDNLAKRIGIEHNNIHFALPSSAVDRLFTFRAALYAEAGYTNEAQLTTVEPPSSRDKESKWKDGLCTMLGIVDTETTTRRKKLSNLYGMELRLALSSCRVWTKLTEFVHRWQQGGILKQPKGSRHLKSNHLRFLDGKDDDKKMDILQKLLNRELAYGFDKKKTPNKATVGAAKATKAETTGEPPESHETERHRNGGPTSDNDSTAGVSETTHAEQEKDDTIARLKDDVVKLRNELKCLKEAHKKKESDLLKQLEKEKAKCELLRHDKSEIQKMMKGLMYENSKLEEDLHKKSQICGEQEPTTLTGVGKKRRVSGEGDDSGDADQAHCAKSTKRQEKDTEYRQVHQDDTEQCNCQGACNCAESSSTISYQFSPELPNYPALSSPSSYQPSPEMPDLTPSSPISFQPSPELPNCTLSSPSSYPPSQEMPNLTPSSPTSYQPSPGMPNDTVSSPSQYQPSPDADCHDIFSPKYKSGLTTRDCNENYSDDSMASDVFDFNEEDNPNALTYSVREKTHDCSSVSDSDLGVHRLESSDEDPSGLSDTNSEPFDSSYYIEPQRTPMKRATKKPTGGSGGRLFAKAVDRETLYRVLSMSPCCRSKCSKSFTYDDLKKNREAYFGNVDASTRSAWLVDKLATFQNSESKSTFSFKADGKSMCREAWCRLHGITKNVFYKGRAAFLNGRTSASERIRRRSKSMAYVRATVWFGMFAAAHAEKMPHRSEMWLPYRTRKQGVYHQYHQEMSEEMEPCCSKQTFYNMWNEAHPNVKIKKSSLFTKCKKCVQLERRLERTRDPKKRKEIQDRRRAHLDRQMRERISYYRRREAARRNPKRYLSLIIDGMDQAKTYLPHFIGDKSKDMETTDLMKVYVSGIISHGHGIKATFTDVFEYSHDSNLTINLLLKMLYRLSKRGPLPPILYLQADNCARENKNRFMLAFLDLLVHRKIFVEVQLSFLYVGHTHEDIDQLFSQIADKLRHEEARTPKQLLEMLPDAAEMRGLYDVRGWLEPYIVNIKGHSKVGIFRFRKSKTISDRVDMFYRRDHEQKWKILRTGMFRTDEQNIPIRPAGKPKLLMPVFEKAEINVGNLMTQKLPKWTPYLESEEETEYWKEYLGKLKTAAQSQAAKIRYASGDRTGWLLNRLRPCDPRELENKEGAEKCISEELDRLLEEELESVEIVVQGSIVGKRE